MKIAHFAIITLIGRNSETVFRQPAGFPKRGMAEDATRGDATGVASSTEDLVTNLSNVDDFFFPSPPPLAELACMQIGLDLWRQEINAHRTSGDAMRKRDPRRDAPLSCILPNVPSGILSLIQPYAQKIGLNIGHWLIHHAEYVTVGFEFLNRFCDFAIDFDGSIHHTRTAQRIVKSDAVSDYIKFKTAGLYCLEDDVVRLWPSVGAQMSIDDADFYTHPQLNYWLRRLQGLPSTNLEPNTEIRLPDPYYVYSDDDYSDEDLYDDFHYDETASVDRQRNTETHILDDLYEDFDYSCWSAVKYFWNKLNPASRRIYQMKLYQYSAASDRKEIFLRYVLAKLSEEELRGFVNEHGDRLLSSCPSPYIVRTWMFIKNAMTESTFCRLVKTILNGYTKNSIPNDDHDMSKWCQVWSTASNHLKESVISKMIRSETPLAFFHRLHKKCPQYSKALAIAERKSMRLQLAILSEVSLHERAIFLQRNWVNVVRLAQSDHLRTFIDLCFSDELQKHLFKKECVSCNSEVTHRFICALRDGDFDELEQMLAFWCPNQQTTETFVLCKPDSSKLHCATMNDVRLYLLQNDFVVTNELIGKADSLNQFIYTAFNDIQLASDFKNQLFATHREETIESLKYCIRNGRFRDVMQLVDLFAPSEEIALRVKQDDIVPVLRNTLKDMSADYLDNCLGKNFEEFESFIPWLLGSDDVIREFKWQLDIDELVSHLFRCKTFSLSKNSPHGVDFDWFRRRFQNIKPTDSAMAKFLKWYFVTSESLLEFKQRFVMSVLSI